MTQKEGIIGGKNMKNAKTAVSSLTRFEIRLHFCDAKIKVPLSQALAGNARPRCI
jgi:hypothetical protein